MNLMKISKTVQSRKSEVRSNYLILLALPNTSKLKLLTKTSTSIKTVIVPNNQLIQETN